MVATNGPKRRKGGGNEIISRATGGASEALTYVKDQTVAASRQAKDGAGQVVRALLETVQEEAERLYGRHKDRAVSRVGSLGKVAKRSAHALHAVRADAAAEYLEAASRRVTQATEYMKQQPLSRMLEDASEIARRNRGITAGGLFVLGFAAIRFLRATESREARAQTTRADNAPARRNGRKTESKATGRARRRRAAATRRERA